MCNWCHTRVRFIHLLLLRSLLTEKRKHSHSSSYYILTITISLSLFSLLTNPFFFVFQLVIVVVSQTVIQNSRPHQQLAVLRSAILRSSSSYLFFNLFILSFLLLSLLLLFLFLKYFLTHKKEFSSSFHFRIVYIYIIYKRGRVMFTLSSPIVNHCRFPSHAVWLQHRIFTAIWDFSWWTVHSYCCCCCYCYFTIYFCIYTVPSSSSLVSVKGV